MKRIMICAICLLMLIGCTGNDMQSTDVENVSIRIENISPTGATVVIRDTNAQPYVYGEWYQIECRDGDDWRALDPVIEHYGFEEIGYLPIEGQDELTFTIQWEWLYGKLSPGEYRLAKEVGGQRIYVCFAIESAG